MSDRVAIIEAGSETVQRTAPLKRAQFHEDVPVANPPAGKAIEKAIDYHTLPNEALVASGDRGAELQIMRRALYGLDWAPYNLESAVEAAKKLAAARDPFGAVALAGFLQKGIGISQDIVRARELRASAMPILVAAVEQKQNPNLYAQYFLATALLQNIADENAFLARAEKTGTLAAKKIKGRRFDLRIKLSEAVTLFVKPAQVLPEAAYELGVCLMEGIGREIRRDLASPQIIFAADKGHMGAQFIASQIYREGAEGGWGVAQDLKAADAWLKSAHDQGHPEAVTLISQPTAQTGEPHPGLQTLSQMPEPQ